jgi:hypothetical protein
MNILFCAHLLYWNGRWFRIHIALVTVIVRFTTDKSCVQAPLFQSIQNVTDILSDKYLESSWIYLDGLEKFGTNNCAAEWREEFLLFLEKK